MGGIQGAGMGLRSTHFAHLFNLKPKVNWFEVLGDHFLNSNGILLAKVKWVAEHYPIVMHCVGMSLASKDELNWSYLTAIKKLADQLNPHWLSDHLCWVSHHGHYLHDLMPFAYTEKALSHVAERVERIQSFFNRPLLLENLSSYLWFKSNEMSEAEFLAQMAKRTGCGILLDVNNVYVSSQNHGFSAEAYFACFSPKTIQQMHLAGFTKQENWLIDTHSRAVQPEVWALYQKACEYFPHVPVSVEWDDDIPSFDTMWREAQKAQVIMESHPLTSPATPAVSSTLGLSPVQQVSLPPDLMHDDLMGAVSTGKWQKNNQAQTFEGTPARIQEGLLIYHNSILGNRLAALKKMYPVTERFVGEECFNALAMPYLYEAKTKSPDPSELCYAWLKTFTRHPILEEVPYLYDLMHFEKAWYQAFHSTNFPGVDFQQLAQQLEDLQEEIIFKWVPESYSVVSSFALMDLWHYGQPEHSLNQACPVDEQQPKVFWLWQQDGHVQMASLAQVTLSYYQFFKEGATLSEGMDYLEREWDETNFQRLIQLGLLRVV